jgi:hypothetical protein
MGYQEQKQAWQRALIESLHGPLEAPVEPGLSEGEVDFDGGVREPARVSALVPQPEMQNAGLPWPAFHAANNGPPKKGRVGVSGIYPVVAEANKGEL